MKLPWAKLREPSYLYYGVDIANKVTLLMQLIEVLCSNEVNKREAISEKVPDLLMMAIVMYEPIKRNNIITPLFKQSLRLLLVFCDVPDTLKIIFANKAVVDILVQYINIGNDEMIDVVNKSKDRVAVLKVQKGTFDAEYHGALICKILRFITRDNDLSEVFTNEYP